MTPTDYAYFTALTRLPKVKLKVSNRTERTGDEAITHVTIENPSRSLAFFVRLRVQKRRQGRGDFAGHLGGQLHFACSPGERREVTADLPRQQTRR